MVVENHILAKRRAKALSRAGEANGLRQELDGLALGSRTSEQVALALVAELGPHEVELSLRFDTFHHGRHLELPRETRDGADDRLAILAMKHVVDERPVDLD